MRVTADEYPCRITNLQTGEDIRWCIWADDMTGEAMVLDCDKDGIAEVDDYGNPKHKLLTGLGIKITRL